MSRRSTEYQTAVPDPAVPNPQEKQPLGESVGDIIDRATALVHDEIELARTEITISIKNLMRGWIAAIVGGVFGFFGLIIMLIGVAFFLDDLIANQYLWLGFFIVAVFLFIIGTIAAFFALKKIQKGSKLVPEMAIAEARKTQDALQPDTNAPRIQQFDAVAVEETTGDGSGSSTPAAPSETSDPKKSVD
jgi:uncharacterized membrane protein YqjE